MGIAAVDRNDGFLRVVFEGLLFDPQTFGNIVRNSWEGDGAKPRRDDCKEQDHRCRTMSCHLRSPNDRVRRVARTEFIFETC